MGEIVRIGNEPITLPLTSGESTDIPIAAPNGITAGMLVQDNMLFLSEYGQDRVSIYDLHDPLNPTLVSRFTTGTDQPRWFVLFDNILAVLSRGPAQTEIIQFWDIINVSSPSLVGSLVPDHGLPKEMFYRDGHLFITHAESEDPGTYPSPFNGIAKWAITFPTNGRTLTVQKVAEIQTVYAKFATSVTPNGTIFTGGAGPMINVIDSNGSMSMLYEGNFGQNGGHAGTTVFNNTTAYVTDDVFVGPEANLLTVDISNPTTPTVLTTTPIPDPDLVTATIVGEMRILGKYLYAVTGQHAANELGYLHRFDISDARNPVFVDQKQINTGGLGFIELYEAPDGKQYAYLNGHFTPYNLVALRVA